MDTKKTFTFTTKLFYIIAIVVSLVAIYYINSVYNMPQPYVYMSYNSVGQYGSGFVNNTLSYPIQIKTIYCSTPNGQKQEFGTPNNNTLNPGTNTVIVIGITNKSHALSSNCSDWKVDYVKTTYISANQPFSITPTTNSQSKT